MSLRFRRLPRPLALFGLVAVMALASVGVFVTTRSADDYRAQLERLLHARTGLYVTIDGALALSLWPRPELTMNQLSALWRPGRTVPLLEAERVRLSVEWLPLLPPHPRLHLRELVATDARVHLRIDEHGFPNWRRTAADVDRYAHDDAPSLVPPVSGVDSLSLRRARATFTDVRGGGRYTLRGLELHAETTPDARHDGARETLADHRLTARTSAWPTLRRWLRTVRGTLRAAVARTVLPNLELHDLRVHARREANSLTATLTGTPAQGDRAHARLRGEFATAPPRWQLEAKARALPFAALARTLGLPPIIRDAIAVQGALRSRGASAARVARTLSGHIRFEGRQGEVGVTALRSILLAAARIAGHGERLVGWRDRVAYQHLGGRLTFADGLAEQRLRLVIDNLLITATGHLALTEGAWSYAMDATLRSDSSPATFPIHPALRDARWPLHCAGRLARGRGACRAERSALRERVADVLNRSAGERIQSDVRERLEKALQTPAPSLMHELRSRREQADRP